jgi:hypothetical protein
MSDREFLSDVAHKDPTQPNPPRSRPNPTQPAYSSTQPNPTREIRKFSQPDPTQPDPTRPNPRVDPTRGQLWNAPACTRVSYTIGTFNFYSMALGSLFLFG